MSKPVSATRHADLVALIQTYLADSSRSARWLGLRVAGDARLVPILARGQAYPPSALVALCGHILGFYERRREDEVMQPLVIAQPEGLPLAA